jgi:hypothetical protein
VSTYGSEGALVGNRQGHPALSALASGEAERLRAGASGATRAQDGEARSRRATTYALRSAPAIDSRGVAINLNTSLAKTWLASIKAPTSMMALRNKGGDPHHS